MSIQLVYNSLYCRIDGDYPRDVVHKTTSYSNPNAYFIQKYYKKKRQWDGRQSLMIKKKNEVFFPTGLIYHVKTALEKNGCTDISIYPQVDTPQMECNPIDLDGIEFRDYQIETIENMRKYERGILHLATATGKTEIMIGFTQYSGLPTLFVVYGNDLVKQTYERYQDRIGGWAKRTGRKIGIFSGNKTDPGDILIASITKLGVALKKYPKEFKDFFSKYKVLILDEMHMNGASKFYKTCMALPSYYRFGASGTPLSRGDNANKRIIAVTGPVIHRVTTKEMIEQGYLAKTDIEFVACQDSGMSIKEYVKHSGKTYPKLYEKFVVENPLRNNKLCQKAKEWSNNGQSLIILVRAIKHGNIIKDMLSSDPYNIHCEFIYGKDKQEKREETKAQFLQGTLKVLIASTIYDQGIDLPNIDVLILGGGEKSHIKTLQRIGRGLRGSHLRVIDFADKMHPIFKRQALERLKHYQKEDVYNIVFTDEECVRSDETNPQKGCGAVCN